MVILLGTIFFRSQMKPQFANFRGNCFSALPNLLLISSYINVYQYIWEDAANVISKYPILYFSEDAALEHSEAFPYSFTLLPSVKVFCIWNFLSNQILVSYLYSLRGIATNFGFNSKSLTAKLRAVQLKLFFPVSFELFILQEKFWYEFFSPLCKAFITFFLAL